MALIRACLMGIAALSAGCGMVAVSERQAIASSCTPSVPLSGAAGPASLGMPSREIIPGGSADYGNIASLPPDPYCSSNYERIDFCTNRQNPPVPSIVRRVGLSRPRDASDTVTPYLSTGRDMGDFEGGSISFACRAGAINGSIRRCYVRNTSLSEFGECASGDVPVADVNAACPAGAFCYTIAGFGGGLHACASSDGPPRPTECPGLTVVTPNCNQIPAPIPALHPEPGDRVVLPYNRTSNDGRLLLHPGYRSWPSISVFRPEAIADDHVQAADVSGFAPTAAADMSPLVWFNPVNTAFKVRGAPGVLDSESEIRQLHVVADLSHSILCDGSSSSFDAGGRLRNPVPCTARYGDYPFDGQPPEAADLEIRNGVCYRVTFLASASEQDHWELRSTPVTVFVPNAYRISTGSGIWIFPDNPTGAFDRPDEQGNVLLPDYADYDMVRMFPWDSLNVSTDLSVPQDLTRFVTSHALTTSNNALPVNAACYQLTEGGFAPTQAPPPWCDFLFNQHRSSRFYFDDDGDAVPERHPTSSHVSGWNGIGQGRALFEIATTGDGRLMVVNGMQGFYYSTNSIGACRADGFHSFLPYSLMPIDSDMLQRNYGIARATNGAPFRDSLGAEIPFGSRQPFAYGWLDRAGSNMLLATFNEQRDAYHTIDFRRLPADARLGQPTITPVADTSAPGGVHFSEAPAGRDSLNTRAGHHIAVLGAWTQGQIIVLDNGLNSTDFGGAGWFGNAPALGRSIPYRFQFDLALYQENSLRFIPAPSATLGSFENRFNYFEAFRPTLPFDVVWTGVSDNQTMSEIVFDDYLDSRAFAVLHMNAPVSVDDRSESRSATGRSRMVVHDGFVATSDYWSDPNYVFNTDPFLDPSLGGRPMLQNAAPRSTITRTLVRGGARIEPIALGGVLGKGLFLDGANDFVEMTYPDSTDRNWYLGAWVEPQPERRSIVFGQGSDPTPSGYRPPPNQSQTPIRVLFYFADGSFVGLQETVSGFDIAVWAQNPGELRTLRLSDLVQASRFSHVAVRSVLTGSDRTVYVYINGTQVGVLAFAGHGRGLTVMGNCGQSQCAQETRLVIGSPLAGGVRQLPVRTFRGWVDEVRVYRLRDEDSIANPAFDEQICNFALGTLAEGGRPGAPLPSRLEAAMEHMVSRTGVEIQFICDQLIVETIDEPFDLPRQQHRTDCASHVHDSVLPPYCVRAEFLGTSPLRPNLPRPSSANNTFCLSCHTEGASIPGLSLGALRGPQNPFEQSVARYADNRRQPLNPPAVIGLPRHACPESPQLNNTWYSLFQERGSLPQGDGTWTTDHVFDGASFFESGPF